VDTTNPPRRVLITGAEGYIGRLLTEALAADRGDLEAIVATDLRAPEAPVPGVIHAPLDITRAADVRALLSKHRPDTVVHLAAVVTPRPDQGRDRQRRVDVDGTRHLLDACVACGVKQLVYTSSGAAYGYHADNAPLLTEDAPLRGNEAFAYAAHKREVEQMLADARRDHPALKQLVFRVSTILGERVHNQITAMFERPVVLGLKGVDTPFCFVWDQDVVACLALGVRQPEKTGIYNLTGHGVMTLREIAAGMHRPFLALPEGWVRRGLEVLSKRGLSPYGPEQVMFLAHRPVLSNEALVRDFGYRPQKTSREVFDAYRHQRAL
jgi:UDP-glucose 4-epimerase